MNEFISGMLTLECREKIKTPTDIDAICGKIPQWSEFVKESK